MFTSKIDYEKRNCFDKDEETEMNNCITNSTKLLNSLIEANDDPEIFSYLDKTLDFNFIRIKLANAYEHFVTEILKLDKNSSLSVVNNKIEMDHFEDYIGLCF